MRDFLDFKGVSAHQSIKTSLINTSSKEQLFLSLETLLRLFFDSPATLLRFACDPLETLLRLACDSFATRLRLACDSLVTLLPLACDSLDGFITNHRWKT